LGFVWEAKYLNFLKKKTQTSIASIFHYLNKKRVLSESLQQLEKKTVGFFFRFAVFHSS